MYTNRGVVRYDIAMNKFEWCDSIEIDHKIEGVSYSTYFIEKEGNEIFLFDAQDKSICIWNPNKELVKHLKLRVAFEYICDDNSLNEFYLKYIAGPQDDLKGFIQLIDGKGNQNKQEIDVNSVSCGRVIYDMLK